MSRELLYMLYLLINNEINRIYLNYEKIDIYIFVCVLFHVGNNSKTCKYLKYVIETETNLQKS